MSASDHGATTTQVSSAAAVTRLQRELKEFLQQESEGISAFPRDDDIFLWTASILGSSGTAYEGLEYRVGIQFPPDYPFRPPTVTFITPCYHPNVEAKVGGYVCLDILREQWSAVLSLSTVLVSLQSLLSEPNCDSPLNQEAAELWKRGDKNAYKERVVSYHSMGK